MNRNQYNRKSPRNRTFGVGIDVPGTDLKMVGIGMDQNGNSVVRLRPKYGNKRGFSIQTNGNLPMLHRNRRSSKESIAESRYEYGREIYDYIDRFGTRYQTKMALNRNSGGKARAWKDRMPKSNPKYTNNTPARMRRY